MTESEEHGLEDYHDTVTCPRCNGSGEIERPTCAHVDCDEKMMRQPNGSGWVCPIHQGVWI